MTSFDITGKGNMRMKKTLFFVIQTMQSSFLIMSTRCSLETLQGEHTQGARNISYIMPTQVLPSRHKRAADGLNVSLACVHVLLVDPAAPVLCLQLDFAIIRAAHIQVDWLVLPVNCIRSSCAGHV